MQTREFCVMPSQNLSSQILKRLESIDSRLGVIEAKIATPSGETRSANGNMEIELESTVFPDRADVRIGKIMVNEGEGIVVVNGVRYHVEPVGMAILDCLAKAGGGWVSCAEMQAKKPILRDENRIDRVIGKFKKVYWRLRTIIESTPGRGHRIRTP